MFNVKLIEEGKVRISVGNEGTMGVGSEKEGENLIIFRDNDQVWNYKQNPDCSYMFFTDDDKVLKLANTDNFKVRLLGWKAEVASKGKSGDCYFNLYPVNQNCVDIIKLEKGAKYNMEHTKSYQLLSFCQDCVTNAKDGKKFAVGKGTYPSDDLNQIFEIKPIEEGKVRISIGNEGNMGIGSEETGENLIIFGNNDQVWKYRQNPDCSYTFTTDNEKVLTLSNTNSFNTSNPDWKVEVASKDTTGDCNFNIYAVTQECEDIILLNSGAKFRLKHTKSHRFITSCTYCISKVKGGKKYAVGNAANLLYDRNKLLKITIVEDDKVRISFDEGIMGTGREKGGENLIVFGKYHQVWNYEQNSDCSYTFSTDDDKVLTLSNTSNFQTLNPDWKAEVASLDNRGDCNFNITVAPECKDIITLKKKAKFTLQHTKCKQLVGYCKGCITNASDGKKSAVGMDTYPGYDWYNIFEIKVVAEGKVRLSVDKGGTMGIGSSKEGENLIIFSNKDQIWNYRQNFDCSYTFSTNDKKVLTLSNSNNFKISNPGWKVEVASKDDSGDCNFNIAVAPECEDIILLKKGKKLNLEHTRSKVLFSYCTDCITNSIDGKKSAVGKGTYPSVEWFNTFELKLAGEGKVRISISNKEALGIGSDKEGENLIIFSDNDQVWTYKQNPDCSYTFSTPDDKVLTLSNKNKFNTSNPEWKAEVASKDKSGDCNFNIYVATQDCQDIISLETEGKFNLEHTISNRILSFCPGCLINALVGNKCAIGKGTYPSYDWNTLFYLKIAEQGKVRISVINGGTLGIGSDIKGENLINFGENDQVWNYEQNPDCSYTFSTDDDKVLTLSDTNNFPALNPDWKAVVASKNRTGDCNFNIYPLIRKCEDIISQGKGAKFRLEHTRSYRLLSYCPGCLTNVNGARKSAVGQGTYPSDDSNTVFNFKRVGDGKVRISFGNEGIMSIGSEEKGENLIVFGNNDQVWKYRQNPDCSYTFTTDNEKVLTLSNTNSFNTSNPDWKVEVASKDTTGDCNFNIYDVPQECKDIVKLNTGTMFFLQHTDSNLLLYYCKFCVNKTKIAVGRGTYLKYEWRNFIIIKLAGEGKLRISVPDGGIMGIGSGKDGENQIIFGTNDQIWKYNQNPDCSYTFSTPDDKVLTLSKKNNFNTSNPDWKAEVVSKDKSGDCYFNIYIATQRCNDLILLETGDKFNLQHTKSNLLISYCKNCITNVIDEKASAVGKGTYPSYDGNNLFNIKLVDEGKVRITFGKDEKMGLGSKKGVENLIVFGKNDQVWNYIQNPDCNYTFITDDEQFLTLSNTKNFQTLNSDLKAEVASMDTSGDSNFNLAIPNVCDDIIKQNVGAKFTLQHTKSKKLFSFCPYYITNSNDEKKTAVGKNAYPNYDWHSIFEIKLSGKGKVRLSIGTEGNMAIGKEKEGEKQIHFVEYDQDWYYFQYSDCSYTFFTYDYYVLTLSNKNYFKTLKSDMKPEVASKNKTGDFKFNVNVIRDCEDIIEWKNSSYILEHKKSKLLFSYCIGCVDKMKVGVGNGTYPKYGKNNVFEIKFIKEGRVSISIDKANTKKVGQQNRIVFNNNNNLWHYRQNPDCSYTFFTYDYMVLTLSNSNMFGAKKLGWKVEVASKNDYDDSYFNIYPV